MKSETDDRLPPPVFLRRPWSITGRLALLYAGSTTVLLLFAVGFLYWGLKESLAREDRALIRGKLQVLRTLLRDRHDNADVLVSEVEHEAEANELLKYYLRVLDARGRVLIETPGMAGFLPVLLFPEPTPLRAGAPPIVQCQPAPGRCYLLLVGEAAAGPDSSERRVIQIALDVAHNNAFLADYRWKLLAVLGAGTVFAAVAGVGVTLAGLRPLRAIARAIQGITASKLNARLEAERWPGELRQCAVAYDAMLDRLQDSFSRLTEFSAEIAHAMRNPINNLRGETEVALTRARTPEEYRQVLGSSLEEFARLSNMIEGLLFIARADDPRTAFERVRFPVRREMNAVGEFYDALAEERGVTVTCEGDAELTGDPMLVRRALSNLLGNALKHTPAGGRVTLTARALGASGAEITVADTGGGIEPEHLPRVFDRFFQVDKTRDTTAKGAGLGLAIVRSIMRLHGGEAAITSTVGQGTTVTLRFPFVGILAKEVVRLS
jgi:two-component system heavy metal sensor histidine kinase CusS